MISKQVSGLLLAGIAIGVICVGGVSGAEIPRAPAFSTLVPVEDLVGQAKDYVEELEECVENLEEYQDSVDKIKRYSDSLAVIALAIGLHDRDSELRKAAPVLVKTCQELSAAKDFAEARAAVARVKAALSASGDPSALKWTKVASLHTLMEQVPLINTRIKRYIRRFERGAPYIKGNSAALVAIGQGSMANAAETQAPDKVAEWYKYCTDMRDSAAALNRAVHAKNEDAAKSAMEKLQQSCDDCHAVFHKDEE